MGLASNIKERPDVSVEERTSSELVKLVKKLRWIGMEDEAEQIQVVLRGVDLATTLLAAVGTETSLSPVAPMKVPCQPT
jgi:hypothetical protein